MSQRITPSHVATRATVAARFATCLLAGATLLAPRVAAAQDEDARPSIEEATEGMERMDGFFPLYWDAGEAQLWMEIDALDTEVLHIAGLGAGLGSNDIGHDRGENQGSRIVHFERHGPRVLMVQPNYDFRASSDNPAEVQAVEDAFARSVLFSFDVEAETGDRILVDMTDFLIRDATGLAGGLSPGTYRLEAERSTIYMPMTMNFPENTEMEVELTFVRSGGGGGFGGAFEGVGNVAATGEAASLRVHHSFVALPDEGYETRAFDPRAGYGSVSWQDYAAPLSEPLTQRYIRRHRLEKQDPDAEMGPPVEPIVYYLDPGAPEPIRSALLDGARWWNEAFEAAGYENAFQVEIRPDSISSHDVRFNVINWVHRSTRGWSYGGSVTDPRTGEIIKGVVTLGSLRWRQDYLIAEGLLSPYEEGDETPPELEEWALARIRQLSAHEVGHTIGLGHNYYDSDQGRISVLDYPHPLVTLNDDGTLDYSEVYDVGIGEWDEVAVNYGYRDFPAGVGEAEALQEILDEAWEQDLIYLTNQDISVHPRADQWSNGVDAAAELQRMLDVRAAALSRFGENAIQRGAPLATLEEVLVPLYLHHRYQLDAAASLLGGLDYIYAMRGDGREPFSRVSGSGQRAALTALARSLEPSELALPRSVLELLPPRPPGFGGSRELFPGYTGSTFDPIAPAVVAADLTISNILNDSRTARVLQQNVLDPSLPGLDEVLDGLWTATFDVQPADRYEGEIGRAVERVLVEEVMGLADDADMPQVRAVATERLGAWSTELEGRAASAGEADRAHYGLLVRDIGRFMEGDLEESPLPSRLNAPPGAPIGDAAMEWLRGVWLGGGDASTHPAGRGAGAGRSR